VAVAPGMLAEIMRAFSSQTSPRAMASRQSLADHRGLGSQPGRLLTDLEPPQLAGQWLLSGPGPPLDQDGDRGHRLKMFAPINRGLGFLSGASVRFGIELSA